MDHKVGSEDPVPDSIPDAILAELQHDAARVVRRRHRWRRWRPIASPLRSSDVWFGAVLVFCVLAIGIGLAGGVVYAIVVWPWVGLYVVVPAGVLFAVSLVIAARTRNRWRDWSRW